MPVDPAVPTLRTERLILSGHRPDDFPHCAAPWADPEVTRFISARPATEEESWARFLRYAGPRAVMSCGHWAVEERATGRYLAEVGFADDRRATAPPLGPDPEVGWALAAEAVGRNYATEAVRAALGWADGRTDMGRTPCIVAPEHGRSVRVAEKLGFRRAGEVDHGGLPRIVLRREAAAGR